MQLFIFGENMDSGMNLYYLPGDTDKILSDSNGFDEKLKQGTPIYEIIGFSPEAMAEFYRVGYDYFQKKLFLEAHDVFTFLTAVYPENPDNWIGLGMSLQMLHHYDLAIDSYEIASLEEIDNPIPYFYLGKCFFAIHDRKSSLEALNIAIDVAGDEEAFGELKEQAIKAREILLLDTSSD